MLNDLIFYIAISEIISLFLIVKLFKSSDHWLIKEIVSMICLIPFLGPLLYAFCMDKTKPHDPGLQNRGPRGSYTHEWIGTKPLLKQFVEKNRNKSNKSKNKSD